MKYYFFRDLNHEANLTNLGSYHAAGLVNGIIDEGAKSGKDVLVTFMDPFTGEIYHSWRALKDIELREVNREQYEIMGKFYKKIDQISL